jgi:ribosome-associated heat shock protein Hsp15
MQQHDDTAGGQLTQRLDKWLWAARFFKTRALAVEAINGGKVQVEGQRVRPSRAIRPGSRLSIHKGELAWEIEVLALSKQRRPASEAVGFYSETEASRERRQELVRARREAGESVGSRRGRPSKRDRRQIESFIGRRDRT